MAGIVRNLTNGLLQSPLHDVYPRLPVTPQLHLIQSRQTPQISYSTSSNNPLLHRSTSGIEGILHPGLAILHLRLRSSTHVDHRNTPHQLGQPLLQLLPIIVAGGLLNLNPDLLDPTLQGTAFAHPLDNGGVVLVDAYPLGPTQIVHVHIFQLDPQILGDDPTAGENGDVLQHGLAPVPEAGGLDRRTPKGSADLVDHQGGQGLPLHLLRNHQKGLPRPGNLLQDGQQVLHRADLLLVQQDVRLLQLRLHLLRVGHKVGR